jgi:hypothetical protein
LTIVMSSSSMNVATHTASNVHHLRANQDLLVAPSFPGRRRTRRRSELLRP